MPRIAFTDGITEQHAPQAEAPGVLCHAGQFQALLLFAIQSPTYAGAFDPAAQYGEAVVVDIEARTQRGDVEQVEQVADGEARLGQRQQMFQRHHQRYRATRWLVGDGERQIARVVRRQAAEYRLHVRRISLDIRHHHDHVAR